MSSRLLVVFAAPIAGAGLALATAPMSARAAQESSGGSLTPIVNAVTTVTSPVTSSVQTGVSSVPHVAAPTSVVKPASSTASAGAPRSATTSAGAPGSSASGIGLRLDPLDTCVSCTSATAKSGSSSADSTAIRLLGVDVSSGSSASTSNGSGSLLALPLNPIVGVAIADWLTQAKATSTGSTSHSRAALLDVDLLNGQVATIAVLESISDASWTSNRSTASSQTNGVDANVLGGALVLVLLHSQASSDGHSSVYLIGINGNLIGTASNGQGVITIPIPGVTTITLLQTGANGGSGTTGSGGAIGTITDTLPGVLGPGETGQVLGVASAGGSGPGPLTCASPPCASSNNGNPPSGGTQGAGSHLPNTGGLPGAASSGGLRTPLTGAAVPLGGIALVGAGLALAALRPRRRRSGLRTS